MRQTMLLVTAALMLTACLEEIEPISGVDDSVLTQAVTLVWYPPTQNSDGSPLLDLAGYNIYIGRASNSYDQKIRLDNPGLTAYVVEDLEAGTYYFSATAYNSAGVESRFSGEVVKKLD